MKTKKMKTQTSRVKTIRGQSDDCDPLIISFIINVFCIVQLKLSMSLTHFAGKRKRENSTVDGEFVTLTAADKSTIQAVFSGRHKIASVFNAANPELAAEIIPFFEDECFPASVEVGKQTMDINTPVNIRQARKLMLALAKAIFAAYTANYMKLPDLERCKVRKPSQSVLVYFFTDDGSVHQMIQMEQQKWTKEMVVQMEKEMRAKYPWPPKPQEREGGLKDNLIPRKIDLFNAKNKAIKEAYKGVAEAAFPSETTIGNYLASFAILAKALAQTMTDVYAALPDAVKDGFYPPTYPTVRYFLATPGLRIGGEILPNSIDILSYGSAYQGACHALIAGLTA